MKVNGTKAGESNNSVMHGSPAAGAEEDATKSANVGIAAQLLLVPPAEVVETTIVNRYIDMRFEYFSISAGPAARNSREQLPFVCLVHQRKW
jgi:hypothetical protein